MKIAKPEIVFYFLDKFKVLQKNDAKRNAKLGKNEM